MTARGVANSNWRGGRTVTPSGYVLIRLPDHPSADVRGYIYEHRLVMERQLGRALLPGERVRHRDLNPGNNDPGNLVLADSLDRRAVIECACGCGAWFTRLDKSGRPRRFATGHNSKSRGIRIGGRPRSETGAGLTDEQRDDLTDMFGGLCAYGCGRLATCWDHVVPWAAGGSFRSMGNAVPACKPCNQGKSDATGHELWRWIDQGLAAHGQVWEDLICLGVSWGALDVPELEMTS